jgi:hypothetical protein
MSSRRALATTGSSARGSAASASSRGGSSALHLPPGKFFVFLVTMAGIVSAVVALFVVLLTRPRGPASAPPAAARNLRYNPTKQRLLWDVPSSDGGGDIEYIVTVLLNGQPAGPPALVSETWFDLPDEIEIIGKHATFTVQVRNGVGLSPPELLVDVTGCPTDSPFVYGNADSGFFCCPDKEAARRGNCGKGVCCARPGATGGCQHLPSCGVAGPRSCPKETPWLSADGKTCCASRENALAGRCTERVCCLEGDCGDDVATMCY